MSTTLNLFDLVFLAFTFIFVLTAFFRGFVKEIFALFSWALALVLSYALAPYVSKFLTTYLSNKVFADLAARFLIFILVFFITAISTSSLCKALKEKMPKPIDKSLGVLYGFLKTLLIFGFVYSMTLNAYSSLLGKKSEDKEEVQKIPSWLQEAKSYGILRYVGEAIDPVVKKVFDAVMENFDKVTPEDKSGLDDKLNELVNQENSVKNTPNTSDSVGNGTNLDDTGNTDYGYSKKQIEKMNRLIGIIEK